MFFRYLNKALDALLLPFMQGTSTLSSAWLSGCCSGWPTPSRRRNAWSLFFPRRS